MKNFLFLSAGAALAVVVLANAAVADADTVPVRIAGEKVDSGLGELPHYSQWADPSGKTVTPARTKVVLRNGKPAVPKREDASTPEQRALQVSQSK